VNIGCSEIAPLLSMVAAELESDKRKGSLGIDKNRISPLRRFIV
jgi:hypothetical protein